MPIITLTTDFGTADWFVGSMKGVILGLAPQAQIVDITHEVPAGDLRAGAFALRAAYRCFPRLTVHVVVVDPGVGGPRGILVARTGDHFFVGPDNGVLSWALALEKVIELRRVENEILFRQPVSATFHGRDLFAPVAARLTQGILVDSLGPSVTDYVRLPWPAARVEGGALVGEVLYVDRFGNAITNLEPDQLPGAGQHAGRVTAGSAAAIPLKKTYQAVGPGQPVAVVGSAGFIEVAVNGGHAATMLGLAVGDRVEVR